MIFVDGLVLRVHVHLGSLGHPRRYRVLSGTRNLILPRLHHALPLLRANPPASRLELRGVGVWVILAWARLERLCLLELKVAPSLSADPERRFTLPHEAICRRVVAGTRLRGLFSALGRFVQFGAHRVRWHVFTCVRLGDVVPRAWHFQFLAALFNAFGSSETETRSSLLDFVGLLSIGARPRGDRFATKCAALPRTELH